MLRLLAAILSLAVAPFGVALHSPSATPAEETPPAQETPPQEAHPHEGRDTSWNDSWAEPLPYVPPQPYTLTLDASHMPGERGWFLVPLTAAQPVSIEMETKYRMAFDGSRTQAAAIIVGAVDDPWANVMPMQGWSWRDVEVNHHGRRLTCCQETTTRLPWNAPGHSSGSSGGGGSFLDAGRTLYVGLAADGWAPGSKLKIELTSWGAPLLMGAPVKGTTAEALDLVDEARKAGRNARVGGTTLVGASGDVARSWLPVGTGLLALDAGAQHDAWGTLTVNVPGEAALKNERLQDEYLYLVALRAGAPLELRLSDLHEPRPGLLGQGGQYGWLHARALYADLSVPLRTYQMALTPIEYEDEDW